MLRLAMLVAGVTGSSAAYCIAGATNPADSNPGTVTVNGGNTLTFAPPCPGTSMY